MAVTLLAAIIGALSLPTVGAATSTMTDLHNGFRRTLAEGKQEGKNGPLTAAKDMAKLSWDYNAEVLAQTEAKKCAAAITAPTDYGSVQSMITVGKTCDASATVEKEIKTWWDEGAAKQETKTKLADNDKFSQMAYAKTSAVACSYYPCSSTQLSLVCLYNKDASDAAVTDLYTENADGCDCAGCTAYLCPSEFTPAELSSLVCTGCDKSTQLFREAALYSHNYYRRLVATGWAEDAKGKYAKPAKAMMELKYDKALEDSAKAHVDANPNTCPTAPQNADYAGENFWTSTEFSLSQEEAVEKAVQEWFSYLTDTGLGDDLIYANLKEDSGKMFGNVIHDKTTKIGCYVKACAKQGVIVVDCRYDPKAGGSIYETGKTCSSCGNAKCSPLGGLCA